MSYKASISTVLLCSMLLSCDVFRKNKCEWFLVPEPEHRHLVEGGMVSVCAKNYDLGRQKCFFQAPLSVAEGMFNKPFVFDRMEYDNDTFPKTITSVKPCTP